VLLILASHHTSSRVDDLELLITAKFVQDWEVSNLNPFWSDEDTVICCALEVTRAFDTAIVLAGGFIEANPYPGTETRDLGDVANELNCATAAVRVWKQTCSRVECYACALN